jgi:two-component system, NarL family, response regulator DegU
MAHPNQKKVNQTQKCMLNIVLAEDYIATRKKVVEWLEQETCWNIIGEVETGREAIEISQNRSPDVVVMDVRMPEMNGIEATKIIVEDQPQTKVVILSNCTDSYTVNAAIEAGANAYVAKQRAIEDLIPGICAAVEGGQFISSFIDL